MIGDPFCKFTKAIGAQVDKSSKGLGIRSNRYTMLLEDGVVKKIEEEKETAGYSTFETKSERDFSTFHADELSEVMRLINEVGRALATRFSRRTKETKKRGQFDFRRTMRLSLRRGGEILDLAHYRRRRQRLKLVLLCDVSKSMDIYSRFLIQFIYAFQSVYKRIETFVFGTSLHLSLIHI